MKRFLIVGGIVAFAVLLTCVGAPLVRILSMPEQPPQPGELAFENANRLINRHDEDIAFGNSYRARSMAEAYAERFKTLREAFFTDGEEGGISLTDGHFLTYCRVNADSVVFLVHVPQLRRYDSDAEDSLAELAWVIAKKVVEAEAIKPKDELVVGVRGAMLYSRIMIGDPADEAPAPAPGMRDVLYPYFVDQDSLQDEAEEEQAARTQMEAS